jgi:integrase
MSRPTESMKRLGMTVLKPKRRKSAGYIARWTDPISGRRHQKQLGTRLARDAGALAGVLAEEIEAGLHSGGLSWLTFCARYEQQQLQDHSSSSLERWRTMKWFVEEHCPLASIERANDRWFDRFAAAVYAKDASKDTVATYFATIKAALRWAARKRYIPYAPEIEVKWGHQARSDAVTPEQFELMLKYVPIVRPKDAPYWRRLLRGQFYTGLRIGEMLALSWDEGADLQVVELPHPAIHFRKQKNQKRQVRPLVPEAWEIIADMPVRQGLVFPITVKSHGGQMSTGKVIQRIADIGKAAKIVTNRETGKHATSHDIRRAFYDWAEAKYGQQVASLLLRHADRETTDAFYNTHEAEKLAVMLWEK